MPSIEPSNSRAVGPDGKPALPRSPGTILVADDEHLIATGIAANIAGMGLQVAGPAADGEEAIELCRRLRPDLALLDIRMPKVGGIDAAKVIYHQYEIPVVIISAYSDQEYVDDAAQVGVFGYLLKPISSDQLRTAIQVAWSRYLASREQSEEISSLHERLENRKIIEQAKWVLVKRKNIDEPDAMRTLQRQARNNRRTLVDVARAILDSDTVFND